MFGTIIRMHNSYHQIFRRNKRRTTMNFEVRSGVDGVGIKSAVPPRILCEARGIAELAKEAVPPNVTCDARGLTGLTISRTPKNSVRSSRDYWVD